MGIEAKAGNIVNRIACRRTCTKMVGANIHGIGTVVDGRHATFQILCRCKKFKCPHNSTVDVGIAALIYLVDVVWSDLIDIVVEPIVVEQIGMGSPSDYRPV